MNRLDLHIEKPQDHDDVWQPVAELDGKVLIHRHTGQLRFARVGPVVTLDATVVAIRHGETDFNAMENSWQGCVNARQNQLNARGREQAERTARQLFRQIVENLKSKQRVRKRFQDLIIFSSQLDRAKVTAQTFVDYAQQELKKMGIDLRLAIHPDPLLNEISFGFWDNRTMEEITAADPAQAELAHEYMRLNALARARYVRGRRRGESFLDVVLRGFKFLKKLDSERYQGKTILLFSSAVLINALRVSLGDLSLENQEGVIDWRAYSPPHGRQSLLTEGSSGSWFGDLESAVDRLTNEMDLLSRTDLMEGFIEEFVRQMRQARQGQQDSSLAMEPAFHQPVADLTPGKFMGVDVGGTYLRIVLFQVDQQGQVPEWSVLYEEFIIPDSLKMGDEYGPVKGEDLFRFVSSRIEQLLAARDELETPYRIGLTFAFPMKLTGPASGRLTDAIKGIKGWSIPDLAGRDPARELLRSLRMRGLENVEVKALADDTVGTLVAGSRFTHTCVGAGVVGTGTDLAIWENGTAIDIGAGRFDFGPLRDAIMTSFDRIVDHESNDRGQRLFEKLVAGKYLPEMLRAVMLEFISREFMFDGHASSVLQRAHHEYENPHGFRAQDLSSIILDKDSHETTRRILEHSGIRESSLVERIVIKRLARLLIARSAQLAGLAIAAVLRYLQPPDQDQFTFVFDGNVVGRAPGYQTMMRETLRAVLGAEQADKIRLDYRKFASAIGGGLMASMASARQITPREQPVFPGTLV